MSDDETTVRHLRERIANFHSIVQELKDERDELVQLKRDVQAAVGAPTEGEPYIYKVLRARLNNLPSPDKNPEKVMSLRVLA